MDQPSWRPKFRAPRSTVTAVLQSPAFIASRDQAASVIEDPAALRGLADLVEALDYDDAPLSAIADRVTAAVRFLRARAQDLDGVLPAEGRRGSAASGAHSPPTPGAGRAARERLIVAALHYLITPVDLVPDFKAGGYLDDVMVLSWVFGAAAHEIEPFLDDDPY